MSNVNSVTVSGNLTRDIELRRTQSDFVIGNAAIAVERSKKVGDDWEKETSFFDVTLFGGSAEFAAKKLRKGDLVTIQGRLEQQTWEDKDGGGKRSKVVIVATAVDSHGFFRPKDQDNDISASGGGAPAAAQTALPTDDDIPF